MGYSCKILSKTSSKAKLFIFYIISQTLFFLRQIFHNINSLNHILPFITFQNKFYPENILDYPKIPPHCWLWINEYLIQLICPFSPTYILFAWPSPYALNKSIDIWRCVNLSLVSREILLRLASPFTRFWWRICSL